MIWRHQGVHLAPEALRDVWEQGASTCEEDVLEEVSPNSFVAFHDRVVNVLLDALSVDIVAFSHPRLEQDLWAAETLFAEDNLGIVRKYVGLLTGL